MGGSAFARDSRVERLPSPALTLLVLSHTPRAEMKISRGTAPGPALRRSAERHAHAE
jgi:hypothetical protein